MIAAQIFFFFYHRVTHNITVLNTLIAHNGDCNRNEVSVVTKRELDD